MTDQAKRNTLKHVAAMGVGITTVAATSDVMARITSIADLTASTTPTSLDEELVKIFVTARVDLKTNDLEVLLTNTSKATATISHMTPAEINTIHGRFDFQALFDKGELRLAAGESVSVPIQQHSVVLDGSTIQQRATALMQSLRRNVSIVSNGDSFAATTVAETAVLA